MAGMAGMEWRKRQLMCLVSACVCVRVCKRMKFSLARASEMCSSVWEPEKSHWKVAEFRHKPNLATTEQGTFDHTHTQAHTGEQHWHFHSPAPDTSQYIIQRFFGWKSISIQHLFFFVFPIWKFPISPASQPSGKYTVLFVAFFIYFIPIIVNSSSGIHSNMNRENHKTRNCWCLLVCAYWALAGSQQ